MRALLLTGLAALTAGAEPVTPPRLLVIRDVEVVPMDQDHTLAHQDVLVRDGRVSEVRPTGARPEVGASVLEGRGRFLAPGLTDFHVHLYDGEALLSFLAYGVTTVVDLNGSPELLRLRAEVARGARPGPTVFASSPSLNGFPPGNFSFSSVERPEDARAAVSAAARAHFDLLKLYSALPWPAYQAALDEARARGLWVAGHVPFDGGLERALASGLGLVAHAEELLPYLQGGKGPPEDRIPALVALVRASGAAVNPNLFTYLDYLRSVADLPASLEAPELRTVGLAALSEKLPACNRSVRDNPEKFAAALREGSALMAKVTRELSRAGVPLVLGTDTEVFGAAGDSAVRELEALVAAGLTPFEALSSGTRTAGELAARHLGSAPFGMVAPGQRADLVLLGANPLLRVDAYRTVEVVVVRGRVLETAALTRQLEARAVRDAPLRARLVELDRRVAKGELLAAAEGYRALGRERPDPPPIAQAVFRDGVERALDAGDGRAATAMTEAWFALYPRSPGARLARADAALAQGALALARRLFLEVARELPFDVRPRRRLAELDLARTPPAFEPTGRWRLLVLEGRQETNGQPSVLQVSRTEGRLVGELTVGEERFQLPLVVAGGHGLVLRGRAQGNGLELGLEVRGDALIGRWVSGFGRNQPVAGRREADAAR